MARNPYPTAAPFVPEHPNLPRLRQEMRKFVEDLKVVARQIHVRKAA